MPTWGSPRNCLAGRLAKSELFRPKPFSPGTFCPVTCAPVPPMSDQQHSDDLQHLPTADADSVENSRAAKAALWKKISEQRRREREEQTAAQPPQDLVEEPPPAAPERSSRDEWDELFTSSHEELQAATIPTPAPPAQPPRKRSVIRRSTPLITDTEASPSENPHASLRPPAESTDAGTTTRQSSADDDPEAGPAANVGDAREREQAPALQGSPRIQSASPDTATPQTASVPGTSSHSRTAAASEKSDDSPQEVPFLVALLRQKWVQWGGASLSLSLGIHALILGVGGFMVVSQVMLDRQVDFLPGGSQQGQQASEALEHKIQQKKNPWLKKAMPMRKIAAIGSISDIILPDEVPDLLDLPSSNDLLSSSKLGGAGLGGGGFGKGMGLGAKDGMVFQPLSMFGREIKAKRLALVLDVSSSMAPFLPRVIEEVDKVAKGSVIVLYPGCGLDSPPNKGLTGKEIYRTSGPEFERFWRMGGMASLEEARKFKFSRTDPIPSESVYTVLSKRPQTHFIHYVGIGYTWLALLSDHVRQADALYWFSDFQDHVDFQQLDIIRENLLRRKQKLYIQPYQHGSAFDLIKSQLVDPTGGEVIEAVFE
ncbi:MAG: hypothetical protein CJBNEKGG_00337 [Prosthecobacter sp.]|nr:hypothetical protein [Prosthecobacter sp.]